MKKNDATPGCAVLPVVADATAYGEACRYCRRRPGNPGAARPHPSGGGPEGQCARHVPGSGRFPAPAVVVLTGDCFYVTCHTGSTVVSLAAVLAWLVAVAPVG